MPRTYSTYEAKARFSEILRQVRAGQRVVVTYHGREVAEIRPTERLEAEGTVVPPSRSRAELGPLAQRPGALKRFLDNRD